MKASAKFNRLVVVNYLLLLIVPYISSRGSIQFNETASFVINTKEQAETVYDCDALTKMAVKKVLTDDVRIITGYHERLYQLNMLI